MIASAAPRDKKTTFHVVKGTVTAKDSAGGFALRPFLGDLQPATHGFHMHMNRSCRPAEKDGALANQHVSGAEGVDDLPRL
ncbi:MAG: hypothetical protein ACT4QB_23190 [Gammaproteobacteria bacterium]